MSWRWSAATIVALAAGIIALLLALDVGRWQTAFARDDVRFEAAPTRTDLWQPDEVVPFHAAHCLLGVEDDLAYRRTLRSFWLARPEVNPFIQTNSDQLRSQALVSLAAFLRESRSPHRRGQAANLLGVIGLGLATTDKQGRRLRFPQPMAALIAPAVVIPLAAHALLERRARRVSRQLTLTPPPCRSRLGVPVAIAAVAGLLGLAAAQPVLSGTRTQVGRQDAEAYLLFDTSRSMLAKTDPGAPDRLTRAKRLAQQLRTRLADVPVGIASLTDRMLPHLLPTLDASLFVSSLRDAVGVERPPPVGQGTAGDGLQCDREHRPLQLLQAADPEAFARDFQRRREQAVRRRRSAISVAAEPRARPLCARLEFARTNLPAAEPTRPRVSGRRREQSHGGGCRRRRRRPGTR